jgi:pyrimidine operon attenuation protein/uracil phosphoribosyltransferase
VHQHAVQPGRVLLDGDAISRTLSRIAHEIIERNEELDAVALVGIHTRGVPIAHRLRRLIEERAEVELDLGQLDITFHRDDVHVRGGRSPRRPQPVVRDTKLDFDLEGRTLILVDDGLATGSTMRAAAAALRLQQPARLVVAVPVAARSTCVERARAVADVVCAVGVRPCLDASETHGFVIEGRTVILVDDVLYTGRKIRAAIDAIFVFGSPARVQLAVLADRGHRELPIRPDYVGKNLPTSRDERIQVQLVEVDEVDEVVLIGEAEEGGDR